MLKKFTIGDVVMLTAAFASLIFAEIAFFKGETYTGLFVGLWVPSILGFAIYLKLIFKEK